MTWFDAQSIPQSEPLIRLLETSSPGALPGVAPARRHWPNFPSTLSTLAPSGNFFFFLFFLFFIRPRSDVSRHLPLVVKQGCKCRFVLRHVYDNAPSSSPPLLLSSFLLFLPFILHALKRVHTCCFLRHCLLKRTFLTLTNHLKRTRLLACFR